MNRYFIALAALFVSLASFGQDAPQKLGYADTEYILTQLPDAKKVETELQAHYSQLEAQLKAKGAEYERKGKEYQENAAKWVDAVRADKERELQSLQGALQKFQQDAEASYGKKHSDLMAPLYEKVGNAIADVSKENGFSFIITLTAPGGGGNVLLYKDPQFDISKLVLKKLGVTPTAAVTPPANKPKPASN
jgi:outer membrane protein